ncbi:MAG: carboxypeptidase regulatory-like domain-containing protein, partial [Acidobacteriota bacterium]
MHSTFRCRLAIAAVWSLLLIVLPRISHGSESDIALKNLGAVSGQVVDESTGLPIAFADVTLHHETFGASAVADETGHYVVTGLPADDFYYATAFSSGYVRENFDDRPCPSTPIGCNPFLGDPISVQADTTTTGIDFDLEPLGSIAGRVTHTATGLPLPSIEIHVIDLFGSVVAIGSTDADGVYSVGGLETGNYFARTQNFAGYVEEVYDNVLCDRLTHCDPFTSGGTMIPVQINATTPGIDFSLDLGGRIEGTVTAAGSGEPLGFGITVWTLGGQMVDTVSADENGHYVVQGLETGSFRLTAGGFGVQSELYDNIPCPPGYETCDLSLGTPVPVTIESVTAGIDFVLDRLGGIIGTVTSAATGLPIPHTVVEVWDTTGFSPVSTQADEQGNYQLDPLPPGTYFVTAEEDRYFEQVFDGLPCPDPGFDCDPTTGTPIAVALNTIVSGIDFALTRRPAGNIAGTVRSEVNGDLLANVNIDVWDESGSPVAFASTDGGGNYLVVDVPVGSFVVTARATGVFVDELYDDLPCPDLSCDLSTGTPVLVADEVTTTGIDFDLTRLGSIAGTVIDSLIGEPVDLFVRAWNDAGEFAGDSDIGPFGGYEIAGLSPGTYFVDTIDNGAFRDELYDNLPCPNSACDPTTGTPIAVALNSPVTGIDFVLDLDQGLAG